MKLSFPLDDVTALFVCSLVCISVLIKILVLYMNVLALTIVSRIDLIFAYFHILFSSDLAQNCGLSGPLALVRPFTYFPVKMVTPRQTTLDSFGDSDTTWQLVKKRKRSSPSPIKSTEGRKSKYTEPPVHFYGHRIAE